MTHACTEGHEYTCAALVSGLFRSCESLCFESLIFATQESTFKEVMLLLDKMSETSQPSELPWEKLQSCFIFNRTLKNLSPLTTCGKILAHAKQQVVSLREHLGLSVCIFKVGVTASPVHRFKSYWSQNFSVMWIVFQSNDLGMVHMLEAALISEYCHYTGCRNAPHTGGEGALNKKRRSEPPYFVYVVGARADQPKSVGG